MEIVIHPSTIVPEVLKRDNYERWSTFMRHYLVAQGLWDVVQSYRMPQGGNREEWIRKNALALHAIEITCGAEAFDRIRKIRSAKGAWDALAAIYMQETSVVEHYEFPADIFEFHAERQTEQQRQTLHKLICSGDISGVEQFIRETPPDSLHGQEEDLANGRSVGLLEFALLVAITFGQEDMARCLYRETILEYLPGDRVFFLLEECITKKMFDVAFHLLHQFKERATTCPWGSTPIILTLAQTPPPFLRRNQLGFWGRWIYKCTRVAKAYPIKPIRRGDAIVQDQPSKWILVLYKLHLVGLLIGLVLWSLVAFCQIRLVGVLIVVSSFSLVLVLQVDLEGALIGLPLLLLVAIFRVDLLGILFGVFVVLLVILCRRKLIGIPIGMPSLVLGALMSLYFGDIVLSNWMLIGTLVSTPLLIFLTKIYDLKLMDEYAHEVVRFICKSLSDLDPDQFMKSGAVEATFQAIKNGIPELVKELITKDKNADILWSSTDPEDSRNMFACAVAHRQEDVARFLYESGANKYPNMVTTIDEDGNNTLHLAAKLAHSRIGHISGAVMQLQSELRWFKAVEGIVPRFYNKQKRNDGETPFQVFVREHRDLLKDAEAWMKKTAESSTVVGTLIITIMFAAAFTVPGGNNQNTGFPMFLNKTVESSATSSTVVPFMIFAVSDATSLFAASSSVLMFMGILTSRYAYQDFRKSLPIKLIIGLSSLFISIAAMMVAFCATLFMMLNCPLDMVFCLSLISCIPVTLFVLLQSPLLLEIYTSTCSPDIFDRRISLKSEMKACLSLKRRWWFRTSKGMVVVMVCSFALIYFILDIIIENVFIIGYYD